MHRVFPGPLTHGGDLSPPYEGDKCRGTKRYWGVTHGGRHRPYGGGT